MTSRWMLLLSHLVVLTLACTGFTVVTGLADGQFQWEYSRYFSHRGWGTAYPFPYSLPVVLTYLVAYGLGAAAWCMAWRSGSRAIGLAGMLLCVVGFASFAFELTQWLVPHNVSCIASAPIALFALAPLAAILYYRGHKAEPTNSHLPM
jgi:hypothetical protein